MSEAAKRIGKIKALTVACALVYAFSALAILATTSTEISATRDQAIGAPLDHRPLGR